MNVAPEPRTAAAASAIPHRPVRPHVDVSVLELGAPIPVANKTTIDGSPWAVPGDLLLVGSGSDGAALAIVEVLVRPGCGVLRVRRVSGELTPGACRVARAPTIPLDHRALVRRAVVRAPGGGAP